MHSCIHKAWKFQRRPAAWGRFEVRLVHPINCPHLCRAILMRFMCGCPILRLACAATGIC